MSPSLHNQNLKKISGSILDYHHPFARTLILLLFLAGFINSLSAQQVVPQKIEEDEKAALKDTVKLKATGMPELKPFNGDSIIEPYWEFFWIFGDGNFLLTTDSLAKHRYPVPAGDINFKVRTYSTGLYSDLGDRPPKIITGDITVETNTEADPHQVTPVIKDGFLNLQKNHVNIVPEDTTVWVISIKNTFPSAQEVTLSGQVMLFYNSPVEVLEVNYKTKDTTYIPPKAGTAPEFTDFRHDETLFFFNGIDPETYDFINPYWEDVAAGYPNMLLWQYIRLAPGEEKHLFVQFRNDSDLLDQFKSPQIGTNRFMAVMTSYDGNLDFNLTDEEQKLLQDRNVSGYLDSLQIQLIELQPGDDETFFQNDVATQIVDVHEVNSYLAKAHDPNRLLITACSCPPLSGGSQKLLLDLTFTNDGNAPANDIYIEMSIPEQVNFNSITDSLVNLHPALKAGTLGKIELEKDPATRTVTWKLLGFDIRSTTEKGAGHPSTYGQIVFDALTNTGVSLEDVPAMRACIRFNDPAGDPVCTLPAAPIAIPSGDESEAGAILQCEECSAPPANGDLPLPWWLILLLGLLLLIILLWIILRQR